MSMGSRQKCGKDIKHKMAINYNGMKKPQIIFCRCSSYYELCVKDPEEMVNSVATWIGSS
jgi:hypothetical protein